MTQRIFEQQNEHRAKVVRAPQHSMDCREGRDEGRVGFRIISAEWELRQGLS